MKQRPLFVFLGLLLLTLVFAACGSTTGNTSQGGASTTVQVTETEYKIAPSITSFVPGKSYHFVVTNAGQIEHEFMIMPESQGSMSGMSMGDMDKMALASIDSIKPGETKTLDYTFPTSRANSHPEFACYLPGHYEAGMKQGVEVTAS